MSVNHFDRILFRENSRWQTTNLLIHPYPVYLYTAAYGCLCKIHCKSTSSDIWKIYLSGPLIRLYIYVYNKSTPKQPRVHISLISAHSFVNRRTNIKQNHHMFSAWGGHTNAHRHMDAIYCEEGEVQRWSSPISSDERCAWGVNI